MPSLKNKFKDKSKAEIKRNEAEFRRTHNGEMPASDSEIDEVYGPGAATAAMDEAYEKMGRKAKKD